MLRAPQMANAILMSMVVQNDAASSDEDTVVGSITDSPIMSPIVPKVNAFPSIQPLKS